MEVVKNVLSMRKKQKTNKKRSLRNKAWKVFASWIKKRDGYICVTCGVHESNQAGHFFHGVLDFDEENINCQCVRCNHWLSGNLAPYSVYLLEKLGKKKFEALNKRHIMAMSGEYRTEEDYQKIIDKYGD